MRQILQNPDAKDKDRLAAAREFLDRAGFKPIDKVIVSEVDPAVIDTIEKMVNDDSESSS